MFIIQNISEQKYFVDIKHVTVTAYSPDLSDFVTEKLRQAIYIATRTQSRDLFTFR